MPIVDQLENVRSQLGPGDPDRKRPVLCHGQRTVQEFRVDRPLSLGNLDSQDDRSEQPITQIVGHSEVHVSIAYDGTDITIGAWLQLDSIQGVSQVTSCTVNWYEPDGSLVFTAASSSPDALGQFEIVQTQVLSDDVAYYLVASISSPQGVVTTRRGAPTVATV